jgi:hypothetical protein
MDVKDTSVEAVDNVRVQADDHVVQAARDPPGPLRDEDRLERPRLVPRHLQGHRPDARLDRLGDRAVAVRCPSTVRRRRSESLSFEFQTVGRVGLEPTTGRL